MKAKECFSFWPTKAWAHDSTLVIIWDCFCRSWMKKQLSRFVCRIKLLTSLTSKHLRKRLQALLWARVTRLHGKGSGNACSRFQSFGVCLCISASAMTDCSHRLSAVNKWLNWFWVLQFWIRRLRDYVEEHGTYRLKLSQPHLSRSS